ncbi:putative Ig domain-containing protein [Catenovulum sp. SM1970]|uniref:putative Ig domain-containing protein n=1 Tax=Marinifaba aquimaris TaxID=2741323 RepID=UPI001574E99C|nr:putative Ig domain-containing protein [Marinifaba aquimaris]NTS78217.1 putative Ig domain-containing protein [Marinifaba aquimaris]
MATVISGEQLGLFNANQHGNLGGFGMLGRSGEGVYTNVASGNLIIQRQDDILKGLGIDASLLRTYNSQGSFDGDNNDNWRLGFNKNLSLTGNVNSEGSSITRTTADGAAQVFVWDSSKQSYISSDGKGAHDSITFKNDLYQFQEGSSLTTEQYNVAGKLINILDEDGKGVHLTYDVNGFIDQALVDQVSAQQIIDFDYDGDLLQGYSIKEDGVLTESVIYTYDNHKRLETIVVDLTPTIIVDNILGVKESRDGKIYVTRYEYHDDTNKVSKLFLNDKLTQSFEYHPDGKLASITDSENQAISYTYPSALETRVTIGNSINIYRFNANKELLTHHIKESTTAEKLVVRYSYDNQGNVLSMQDGENRKIEYAYDEMGNRTHERDDVGNTVIKSYNSLNQLTQTHSLLSSLATALETIQPDSDTETTHFIYDNNGYQQRFQVSTDGRVLENVFNNFGQLAEQKQYIAKYDVTEGISLLQLETWALGDHQLTKFTYDLRGQLDSSTQYQELNGQGETYKTSYVYDQRGRLLQQVSPKGEKTTDELDHVTQFVYDTLGRLTQTIDAEGNSTSIQYQDSQQRIITIKDAGMSASRQASITTELVDLVGRTTSIARGKNEVLNSDFGTQYSAYNDEGQVIATLDEHYQPTFYFYDDKNQLAYTVDSEQKVTGFEYDQAGNLLKTTRFAKLNDLRLGTVDLYDNKSRLAYQLNPLTGQVLENQFDVNDVITGSNEIDASAIQLSSLTNASVSNLITTASFASALDKTDNQNRVAQTFYDDANRQQFSLDAEGYVTEYIYDEHNRLVLTKAYENANVLSITGDTATLVPSPGSYRFERNIYTQDGLIAAQVDSAGYITEYEYDGAGNKIRETVYNRAVTTNPEQASLSALKAEVHTIIANEEAQGLVTSKAIYNQYWTYDGRGQVKAEINSDNQVTSYQYDENGNLKKSTQYNDLIVNYNGGEIAVPTTNTEQNRVTLYQYDELNRLLEKTTPDGLVINYRYDRAGNLILTQQQDVNTPETNRTQRWQYDERGLLIGELDGEEVGQLSSEDAIQAAFETNGNRYTYDNLGRRTSVTDAEDRTSYFYYNKLGQLKAVINHFGNVVSYEYNNFGEQSRVNQYQKKLPTNALSNQVLTGGDFSDIIGWLNNNVSHPLTTTNFYTARGLIERSVTAADVETSYDYNAFGEIKSVNVGQFGFNTPQEKTVYEYDKRGSITGKFLDGLSSSIFVATEYDAFKRLTKEIDAEGNITEYLYTNDPEGRKVVTSLTGFNINNTQSQKQSTVTTYDAFNRVTETNNQLGHKTQFTYNDSQRKHTRTTAEGIEYTTIFNAFGEIQSMQVGNNTTQYEYDLNGALLKTKTNGDVVEENKYDANGRLEEYIDGENRSIEYKEQTYIENGKELGKETIVTQSVTDSSGNIQELKTIIRENGAGLVVFEQDESGQTTDFIYNAGRLEYQITAKGTQDEQVTHFSYDDVGNIAKKTAGYGTESALVTEYRYDNLGRMILQSQGEISQDKSVSAIQYQYDDNGNVISETTGSISIDTNTANENFVAQYQTRSIYDENRQLIYKLDSDNSLTQFIYDNARQQIAVRQFASFMPDSIAFTSADIEAWTLNQSSRTSYNAYDKDGRLTAQIASDGAIKLLSYNAENKVQEKIEYINTVAIPSNLLEQLKVGDLSAIDSLGSGPYQATSTLYDAKGNAIYSLQKTDDGKAIVKATEYDSSNRVTSTTTYATLEVDYSTDENTFVPHTIGTLEDALVGAYATNDSRNQTSQLFYDEAGRLRFTRNADESVNEIQYFANGQIQTEINHGELTLSAGLSYSALVDAATSSNAEQKVVYQYNDAGQLVSQEDGLGNTESWTYYDNGLKSSYTDKNQQTWHYSYDEAGRLAEEIGPKVKHSNYRTNDGTLATFEAHNVTAYKYDSSGNIDEQRVGLKTNLDSATWYNGFVSNFFGYDDAGRQNRTEAPNDNDTKALISDVKYDALGQAFYQKIISDNGVVEESYKIYDALGRVAYEVDAERYVTGYQYDALGQRTSMTRYANKATGLLSKDASTSINDFRSKFNESVNDRKIEYKYDDLGRLLSMIQPEIEFYTNPNSSSTGSPTTDYVYDSFGQVVETHVHTGLTDSQGQADNQVTYHYYDVMGRKTLEVNPEGYVSKWVYNDLGQVESYIEYAKQLDVTKITSDFPPSVLRASDQTQDRVWSYTYDALGRQETSTQYSYFISSRDSNGISTDYDELTTTTEYDALGNITKITSADGTELTQEYDALSRLITTIEAQRSTITNASELINDGIKQSNAQGQLIQHKVTQFKYDSRGNQVEIRQLNNGTATNTPSGFVFAESNDDIVQQFKYDLRGNIIESKDSNGVKTEYELDHRGRILSEITPYTDLSNLSQYLTINMNVEYINRGQSVGVVTEALSYDRLVDGFVFDVLLGKIIGKISENVLESVFPNHDANAISYTYDIELTVGQNGPQISLFGNSDDQRPMDVPESFITALNSKLPKAYTNRSYEYDKNGNQIASHIYRDGYDAFSGETGQSVLWDQASYAVYNSFGELSYKGNERFSDSDYELYQEKYKFDNAGRLIESIDASGIKKSFGYDLVGNLIYVNDVAQGLSSFAYNKIGQAETKVSPSFVQETNLADYSYDIESVQLIEYIQYDRWNNVTQHVKASTISSDSTTTKYEYNHSNQVVKEIHPSVKLTTPHSDGWSYHKPTFQNYYDEMGRLIASKDANGNYRYNVYNGAGQLSSSTDATGVTIHYGYDVYGRQIAEQQGNDEVNRYITYRELDAKGNVLSANDFTDDQNGNTVLRQIHRSIYNELGQQVRRIDAKGNIYRFWYDQDGNLTRSETPDGMIKSYAWDEMGRKSAEYFGELGNKDLDKGLGIKTWLYDSYNNSLIKKTDLSDRVWNYLYEDNGEFTGRLSEVQVEDTSYKNYSYYDNGQIKSISGNETISYAGESVTPYINYRYDEMGRVIEERNVSFDSLHNIIDETTKTNYDALGRITKVTVRDNITDSTKVMFDYTYDLMGNRTSVDVKNLYTGNIKVDENQAPEAVKQQVNFILKPLKTTLLSFPLSELFIDPNGDLIDIALYNNGALVNPDSGFINYYQDSTKTNLYIEINAPIDIEDKVQFYQNLTIRATDINRDDLEDDTRGLTSEIPVKLSVYNNNQAQTTIETNDIFADLYVGQPFLIRFDPNDYFIDVDGDDLTFSLLIEQGDNLTDFIEYGIDNNNLGYIKTLPGAVIPKGTTTPSLQFNLTASDGYSQSEPLKLHYNLHDLYFNYPEGGLNLIQTEGLGLDLFNNDYFPNQVNPPTFKILSDLSSLPVRFFDGKLEVDPSKIDPTQKLINPTFIEVEAEVDGQVVVDVVDINIYLEPIVPLYQQPLKMDARKQLNSFAIPAFYDPSSSIVDYDILGLPSGVDFYFEPNLNQLVLTGVPVTSTKSELENIQIISRDINGAVKTADISYLVVMDTIKLDSGNPVRLDKIFNIDILNDDFTVTLKSSGRWMNIYQAPVLDKNGDIELDENNIPIQTWWLDLSEVYRGNATEGSIIVSVTQNGISFDETLDIELNYSPNDNLPEIILVEAVDGENDPISDGPDAYNFFTHTFDFSDIDINDSLTFNYQFDGDPQELTISELRLLAPWLHITEDRLSGQVVIKNTANIPVEFIRKEKPYYINVIARDKNSAKGTGELAIQVDPEFKWSEQLNLLDVQSLEQGNKFELSKFIYQADGYDLLDENSQYNVFYYDSNIGDYIRIGSDTYETPVLLNPDTGDLTVNNNYDGPVEQLKLAVRANRIEHENSTLVREGLDRTPISKYFLLDIDYKPQLLSDVQQPKLEATKKFNDIEVLFKDRNNDTPNNLVDSVTNFPISNFEFKFTDKKGTVIEQPSWLGYEYTDLAGGITKLTIKAVSEPPISQADLNNNVINIRVVAKSGNLESPEALVSMTFEKPYEWETLPTNLGTIRYQQSINISTHLYRSGADSYNLDSLSYYDKSIGQWKSAEPDIITIDGKGNIHFNRRTGSIEEIRFKPVAHWGSEGKSTSLARTEWVTLNLDYPLRAFSTSTPEWEIDADNSGKTLEIILSDSNANVSDIYKDTVSANYSYKYETNLRSGDYEVRRNSNVIQVNPKQPFSSSKGTYYFKVIDRYTNNTVTTASIVIVEAEPDDNTSPGTGPNTNTIPELTLIENSSSSFNLENNEVSPAVYFKLEDTLLEGEKIHFEVRADPEITLPNLSPGSIGENIRTLTIPEQTFTNVGVYSFEIRGYDELKGDKSRTTDWIKVTYNVTDNPNPMPEISADFYVNDKPLAQNQAYKTGDIVKVKVEIKDKKQVGDGLIYSSENIPVWLNQINTSTTDNSTKTITLEYEGVIPDDASNSFEMVFDVTDGENEIKKTFTQSIAGSDTSYDPIQFNKALNYTTVGGPHEEKINKILEDSGLANEEIASFKWEIAPDESFVKYDEKKQVLIFNLNKPEFVKKHTFNAKVTFESKKSVNIEFTIDVYNLFQEGDNTKKSLEVTEGKQLNENDLFVEFKDIGHFPTLSYEEDKLPKGLKLVHKTYTDGDYSVARLSVVGTAELSSGGFKLPISATSDDSDNDGKIIKSTDLELKVLPLQVDSPYVKFVKGQSQMPAEGGLVLTGGRVSGDGLIYLQQQDNQPTIINLIYKGEYSGNVLSNLFSLKAYINNRYEGLADEYSYELQFDPEKVPTGLYTFEVSGQSASAFPNLNKVSDKYRLYITSSDTESTSTTSTTQKLTIFNDSNYDIVTTNTSPVSFNLSSYLAPSNTNSLVGLPEGLSFDPMTNNIVGQALPGTEGQYELNVETFDENNQPRIIALNMMVSVSDDLPLPEYTQADINILENTAVEIPLKPLNGIDPLTLNYTFDGLPQGFSYDPTISAFVGTLATGTRGDYPVEVVVTDLWGNTTSAQFNITVGANAVPIAPQMDDIAIKVEQYFAQPLPYFNDDANDVLSYQVFGLPEGVSYNKHNHALVGTPTQSSEGDYLIHLVAKDLMGNQSATSFRLAVQGNSAPNAPEELSVINTPQGQYFSQVLPAFTDAENDFINYELVAVNELGQTTELPNGIYFDKQTRTIWGTPRYPVHGDFTLSYQATDSVGNTNQVEFTLTIEDAPQATIVDLGEYQAYSRTFFYLLSPELNQAAQQGATFEVLSMPDGLSLNADTGEIYGEPITVSNTTQRMQVMAKDAQGVETWYQLNIDVDAGQVLKAKPMDNQYLVEGQYTSFELLPAKNQDNLYAYINYKVIEKPSWLNFSSWNKTFSGTPPLVTGGSGQHQFGAEKVVIEATDGTSGKQVEIAFDVVTMPYNSAPSSRPIGDQYIETQQAVAIDLQQYFNDAENDALTYTANVLIDDYSGDTRVLPLPQGLTINPATGELSGMLTQPGNYRIQVTAQDAFIPVSQEFMLKVNQPPQLPAQSDQQLYTNSRVNISLLNATDFEDTQALTYEISGLPKGLTFYPDTLNIRGYLAENSQGFYNVSLTAIDSQGGQTTQVFSLNVLRNQAPVVPNVDIIDLKAGDSLNQQVAFIDYEGDQLAVAVSGLPDWAWYDSVSQTLYGNVPAQGQGQYPVWLTATDAQGNQTIHRIVLNVDNLVGVTRIATQVEQTFNYTIDSLPNGVDPQEVTSVTVNGLPENFSYNPATGQIEGRASTEQVGNYRLEVITELVGEVRFSESLQLVISNETVKNDFSDFDQLAADNLANKLPELLPMQAKEYEFMHVRIPGLARQADPATGDVIQFELTNLPQGLYFDPAQGIIQGMPAKGSAGNYQVTLIASNQLGQQVNSELVLTINANNTVLAPAVDPIMHHEQAVMSLTLPAFIDPEGEIPVHTLTGLPQGLYFDADTRTIGGKVIEQDLPSSRYTLTYGATDSHGNHSEVEFELTIIRGAMPIEDLATWKTKGDFAFETKVYSQNKVDKAQVDTWVAQALVDAKTQGIDVPDLAGLKLKVEGLPEGITFYGNGDPTADWGQIDWDNYLSQEPTETNPWDTKGWDINGTPTYRDGGYNEIKWVLYRDASTESWQTPVEAFELVIQEQQVYVQEDKRYGYWQENVQADYYGKEFETLPKLLPSTDEIAPWVESALAEVNQNQGSQFTNDQVDIRIDGLPEGMSFDITWEWEHWEIKHFWTHNKGYVLQPGMYNLEAVIYSKNQNAEGAFEQVAQAFTVFVGPNEAPEGEVGQHWFTAGQTETELFMPHIDTENDELLYELVDTVDEDGNRTVKPNWLQLFSYENNPNGELKLKANNPPASAIGDHTITLEVKDLKGHIEFKTFTVTVFDGSASPVAKAIEPINQQTEQDFMVNGAAYFTSGNPLTYQAYMVTQDVLGNDIMMPLPKGVSFDSDTGVLQGKILQPGQYQLAIVASDNWNQSARTDVVVNINQPPRSIGLANQYISTDVDSLFMLAPFTDYEGDILDYQVTGLPKGLTFDPQTMLVQGQVSFGNEGQYTIQVTATDSQGAQSTDSFTLNVLRNQGPQAPSIAPVLNLVDGERWQQSVHFFDQEGDSLDYQVIGLPDWASFDPDSHSIKAHPPEDTNGTWDIFVQVTDQYGRQASIETTLRVSGIQADKQTRIEVPSQTLNYGDDFYLDTHALLPAWGHFINFETLIKNEKGQFQALSNHSANNWLTNNDGVLSGTPGIDDIPVIPMQFKVIADDGLGNKAIIEFTLDINGPVAVPQSTIEAVSGERQVIQLSKLFRGMDVSSYEYRIIPVDADGNDLPLIEAELPEVKRFNAQSGRLELQLVEGILGNFRIEATAIGDTVIEEPVAEIRALAAPMMMAFTSPTPLSASTDTLLDTSNDKPIVNASVLINIDNEASTENYAYKYDAAGRVVLETVEQNNFDGTRFDRETAYVYDDLGRQSLEVDVTNNGFGGSYQGSILSYDYNKDGTIAKLSKAYTSELNNFNNLIESRFSINDGVAEFDTEGLNWSSLMQYKYDALGKVTTQLEFFDVAQEHTFKSKAKGQLVDSLKGVQTFKYTNSGQLEVVKNWQRKSENLLPSSLDNYFTSNILPEDLQVDDYRVVDSNYYYDQQNGLLSRQTNRSYQEDGSRVVQALTYMYQGFDNYQQSTVKSDSSQKHYRDAYSYYYYDLEGNQIAQLSQKVDKDQKADGYNAAYYQYDLMGNIRGKRTGSQSSVSHRAETQGRVNDIIEQMEHINLTDKERFRLTSGIHGKPNFEERVQAQAHYAYAGGNTYSGEFKNSGEINVRDTLFNPIDKDTVNSTQTYTTQGGETLQNLAQMFLGDKDQWYIIAALNGLESPDEPLEQGKVLHIPSQTTAANDSDSFNPINLGEVMENYIPENAFVPPPQEGCNAVATIIMVAVTVVATVYTAGLAAGYSGAAAFGGGLGVLGGGAAAAVGSLGGAIGLSTASAGLLAAGVGGFVGSVAGQLAGKAVGAIDSFSLKDALSSGLTSAATAGMGSVLQGSDAAMLFKDGANATKNAATGLKTLSNTGKAIMGATGAISSVAANKLVGNKASFNWANVAASSIASAATGNTGLPGLDSNGVGIEGVIDGTVAGLASAGISYGVKKAFGEDTSWNFDNVALDAFGNAVGNAIVAGEAKSYNDRQKLRAESGNATLDGAYRGMQRNAVERQFDSQALLLGQNASRAITNQAADDINVDMQKEMANFVDTQQRQITNDTQARFNSDEIARANVNSALMQNSRNLSQEYYNDLANKQASLASVGGDSEWFYRNTFNPNPGFDELSLLPNSNYDLEANIANNTAWQSSPDMEQVLADSLQWNEARSYGPWRDGYFFAPDSPSKGAWSYTKDVLSGSFDYLMNLDKPLSKTFDVLTLAHLKDAPIKSNTLSLGGVGIFRGILGGSGNINFGVQSNGVLGLALSKDGFVQASEQHFKEGIYEIGVDAALQSWSSVTNSATLEDIFTGYSTHTDYDLTAFKYDIGWQESTAWADKPFSSPTLAEGSGPRLGVDLFGRSDKKLFPFEASKGIGHQIGNEINTYDAGVLGRWLYWFTR